MSQWRCTRACPASARLHVHAYPRPRRVKACHRPGQIDATDRRIDRLVYELYELTDEKIRIVEHGTA